MINLGEARKIKILLDDLRTKNPAELIELKARIEKRASVIVGLIAAELDRRKNRTQTERK